MKITEQILALYKVGEVVDRDIVTRDLETTLGGASRALAHLHGLGALTRVSENYPLYYQVTNEAKKVHNAMIEERKSGESVYLERLNAQKAKKRGIPTIIWVKHATSNFAYMGKLPTEPYDSLVRAARGNHS
ncbi:hypothetical protein AB7107_15275 [Proteus terrae]|uniref:hypothetical protein n=1 Tax=Proteus TaxID=583 RepID=UPI001BA80F05|nr:MULTISPECIES: hypothetical protein [Proteus]MCT8265600.1 hypothetical protein [Proteus terrae]WFC27757.1 hypothetical protein PT008_14615 [Proteus mirabilis]